VRFEVHHYHHFPDAVPHDSRLDQLLTLVTQIKGDIKTIMATEQQVAAALTSIDAATTKIGSNLSVIADTQAAQGAVISTISTEVDTLVTALQNAGVSQAIIDQATAISDKASTAASTSDTLVTALQAQIPVLQAIATKGVVNPVPVEPPPPPPPPPPTA